MVSNPVKPATSGLSIQREAPSKTARINYPDLDLMKLAMAFFVVEIHTRPLRDVFVLETIVEGLDVLAVPFFFSASAFPCFKGLSVGDFAVSGSKGSVRVRKTMGKLLQLYITWTVVFLPVTVFGAALQGTGILDGFVSFARGTLLIGESFCSWPLWYLLASVVAFALVYLLLRAGVAPRHILVASSALLLSGYLLTKLLAWNGAPPVVAFPVKACFAVFGTTRNGLFEGFFFVAVGAALGMRHERLAGLPVAGVVAGVVLGILGCMFISNDAHLPFCACAGICAFLLSIRRCGAELRPHVVARNASTAIYLVHSSSPWYLSTAVPSRIFRKFKLTPICPSACLQAAVG